MWGWQCLTVNLWRSYIPSPLELGAGRVASRMFIFIFCGKVH